MNKSTLLKSPPKFTHVPLPGFPNETLCVRSVKRKVVKSWLTDEDADLNIILQCVVCDDEPHKPLLTAKEIGELDMAVWVSMRDAVLQVNGCNADSGN